jgi:hypothetical protein
VRAALPLGAFLSIGVPKPHQGAGSPVSTASAQDTAAFTIVRQALDALGGEQVLARAGGITIAGRGTFDIGARLQGRRPDAVEPRPLEEHLALVVDSAGVSRLAHDTRTGINPDAEEWIRTISKKLFSKRLQRACSRSIPIRSLAIRSRSNGNPSIRVAGF